MRQHQVHVATHLNRTVGRGQLADFPATLTPVNFGVDGARRPIQ